MLALLAGPARPAPTSNPADMLAKIKAEAEAKLKEASLAADKLKSEAELKLKQADEKLKAEADKLKQALKKKADEDESEDESDESTKVPKGKAKNKVPHLKRHLPTKCDWGDIRGDDQDKYYLADRRTGRAKTEDSDVESHARSRRTNRDHAMSRRPRTPIRGRSRSRRPRAVIKKVATESGKGKKKGEKQPEKASSKGEGKPKGKNKPVDDDGALSFIACSLGHSEYM